MEVPLSTLLSPFRIRTISPSPKLRSIIKMGASCLECIVAHIVLTLVSSEAMTSVILLFFLGTMGARHR